MDMNSQRLMGLLPQWVSSYAESIPQLINLLLVVMGMCNFMLFTCCLSTTMMPNLGLNALLLSILLCIQNGITWTIINSTRMPYYCNALQPSDFLVGMCMGIAIGGAILAFVISIFYGEMSKCVTIQISTFTYACEHKGTMSAIWFWAGLIFWCNLAISALIGLGRDELTFLAQSHYDDIGICMDEYPDTIYNGQQPGVSDERRDHDTIGDTPFSTPSQEAICSGGYGYHSQSATITTL